MNTPYRMPSLRSLYAFTYAGRYLSFKEAADALFLTASAVSHQVRNLEDFLGVPLFVRKTRALAFTDAGEKYFNFLDEMSPGSKRRRTSCGRSSAAKSSA